jgi:hypothetical protein
MLNRDFDHYYGESQSGSFCYTGKKSTMEWSSPLPIMLGESPRQAELDQSWQQTHSNIMGKGKTIPWHQGLRLQIQQNNNNNKRN